MILYENDIVELLNLRPGDYSEDGYVIGNRFVVNHHYSVGKRSKFVSVKGFRAYLHTGQWMLYKRPLRNHIKALMVSLRAGSNNNPSAQ